MEAEIRRKPYNAAWGRHAGKRRACWKWGRPRGLSCGLLVRASAATAVQAGNCQEPAAHPDFRKGPTLSYGDKAPQPSKPSPLFRMPEQHGRVMRCAKSNGEGGGYQCSSFPTSSSSQTSEPRATDLLCQRPCEP